ncbi:CoA transferase subunit A [Desulfosporosinus fructosivorans]
MNKLIQINEVMSHVKEGSIIMIGGFEGCGSPESLIDTLVNAGVGNLTVITNDTSFPGRGIGKLVDNKLIKTIITSHIGTNPETGRQMKAGEIEVLLIPQGTLVEKIRSAGAGLGGFLTPTGLGTIVEEGKQKIRVQGKEYLLEVPLKADFALIKAKKADGKGNLVFYRSARNFNPIMATAADFVVAEVEEYVPVGELDPDDVMLPGIFVNAVVKGDK